MRDMTKWVDRVEDQSGEVIQEGTAMSAANFNNIECDLTDQEIAFNLLMNYVSNIGSSVEEEYQEVELTNSASYPFNNSATTISLESVRNTTQYTIDYEVLDNEGLVGDVVFYDKQINGFKMKYTGSATSVIIAVIIKGGN